MPKNKGAGGKSRRRGAGGGDVAKRELVLKEEGQEYGQVTKNLGNSRLEVHCIDGVKRIGVIRGAIRRKMWICVGDIVLVGLRDYEDGKVDVLSRYTPDETKELIKDKHIPAHMQVNDEDRAAGSGMVEFVVGGEDSDSDDDDGRLGLGPARVPDWGDASDDDAAEGAGGAVDVDAI